jgi:uncharacterized membrane protein YhaH (DUF805 family)
MMAKVGASIRYNLGSLARFSGRDSRGQFWPYAIVTFLTAMALGYMAMIPMMFGMLNGFMRAIAEGPDQSPAEKPPGVHGLEASLMSDMTLFMQISLVINLLFVALIAAAAVRRLHDRERSGLWALITLPFWIAGWALSWWNGADYMFATAPDMRLIQLAMLVSWVGWGTLIWLIVILAGDGTKGENRYGTEPPPTA